MKIKRSETKIEKGGFLKTSSNIEQSELVEILKKNGLEDILEILYYENSPDEKVFTKKARLNKSATCRALNCKPKDLEEKFKLCRKILGEDWND